MGTQKDTSVRTMLSIQAEPDIAGIRTAELFNQEHTVIPAVVLVEGVLWPANAPSPELALAEEFGRFPDGWNGRPVVYDHPRVDGLAVSASSPSVLEVNSFGQLFNTRLDGKKLKTEIWINNTRVNAMSQDAQDVIEALKTGDEMIEVSTGLFTMSERINGIYNNQKYDSVWRNIVPDHLAVLPKGVKGACSVADGCGAPRTNNMDPVMRAAQLNTGASAAASSLEGSANGECACDRVPTVDDLNMLQKFTSWCSNVLSVSGDHMVVSTSADTQNLDNISETVIVPGDADDDNQGNIQENAMNREEIVNGLIANEGTQFGEDDREWLMTLEEAQLSRMTPVVASVEETTNVGEQSEGEQPTAVVTPEVNSAAAVKPVTTDDYIANAPAEIQEHLKSGLRLHRARKDALIQGLKNNSRCKYTEAQLKAKDIDELETLVELAAVEVSYEGNGASLAANAGGEDDNLAPPAPLIFTTKNADAA